MNYDLNDFALFDEPQYQEYKRLKNKNYHQDTYGCLVAIVLYLGIGFLISYMTDIEDDKLITIMFIPYTWAIFGWLIYLLRIDRVYYIAFRSLTKKSHSYKSFKRLEKRYLPQEELISVKIKHQLGENSDWNASPSFLSRNLKFLDYVEKAQEKIGSAYPVLKSDIEKAKESIAKKYKRSQTTTTSGTYRPSSKTTVTKKALSKAKSVRQNSSNPDSVTPVQPISPSNSKPLSHTPVPATTAKGKVNPNQPRLTNWEQVNASRLKVGKQGEEFVYQYEQKKLKRLELEHLVGEIEHSSKVIGDGLGYDIKSFNRRGEQVYIEVKTTKGEFWSNLIFTPNELDFAKQNSQQFLLYRVYNFDEETGSGELYIGSYEVIESYFSFEPQSFLAKQKSVS